MIPALVATLVLAGATPAPGCDRRARPGTPPLGIMAENRYYAKPGMGEAVYRWRLHASAVRVKLGLPPGVVYRGPGGRAADAVWQVEFPSLHALRRDIKINAASPEFQAVMVHMGTLIRRFEGRSYELRRVRVEPCVGAMGAGHPSTSSG